MAVRLAYSRAGAQGLGAAVADAAQAASVIVDAMNERGITNKMLAIRTGLSVGCISRLRTGATKWPRDTTLFVVLSVLDLEMIIRRRIR